MKLVIVIAAFNEEKTVARTIRSVKSYGDVVVINDGSSDQTEVIAKSEGAIVFTKPNGGYDSALDEGFRQAAIQGATHVITFDADGQHPAESVPEYIQKFAEGYELVVGIRPRKQRIAESIFALYTRIFYGISDPLCGMKGYDMKLYNKIGWFDSYKSTGTELMLRYLKAGVKSCQLNIWINDREDAPRFGRVFRANIYILKSMVKGILNI